MPLDSSLSALAHLARIRGGDEAFREAEGDGVSYSRLHGAVTALARDYRTYPDTVGLLAPNGIPWAVAKLALMAAGKTIVPLPDFFSRNQLAHIIEDAHIGRVLATATTAEMARNFGLPVSEIAFQDCGEDAPAGRDIGASCQGRLVIYTSGSTGRPKGVCIGAAQLTHSAEALGKAINACPDDTYLSVLPMSLLLEQICAIHAPLQFGARVVFGASITSDRLADLVERVRPSLMVLVPQLLGAWIAALRASGRTAPDSLRLVATGGAPVTETLAAAAWERRIPVHEGYGLSECCSVVALNRPGARAAGTVGQPLDGLEVTLDEGEIVVRGPTIMDGYLNDTGACPAGVWRTGDLGAFDPQGRLIVYGRKDSMLVTSAGRNVVPEWIEALVTTDSRLAHCILIGATQPGLTAILVPHAAYVADYQAMTRADLEDHVARLVASAPAYARPARCLVVPEADLRRRGLLTGNGRPRRTMIKEAFASRRQNFSTAI